MNNEVDIVVAFATPAVRDYAALIDSNLASIEFPIDALPFAIEVTAPEQSTWIVVTEHAGRARTEIRADAPGEPAVKAAIGMENVEYLLESGWQSDVIVIGYGMEFWIGDKVRMTEKLVHALGDVVTHYPKAKNAMIKTPIRFLRWALNNHQARHLLRRKLGMTSSSGHFSDVRLSDWLDHDAATLAAKLGIPSDFIKSRSQPRDSDRRVETAEPIGENVA